MNQKFKDASHLIKSKAYILITDRESVIAGDFKGFSAFMKLHSLKLLQENTGKMIKHLEKTISGKPSGKKRSTKPKATAKPKAKAKSSTKKIK